MRLIGFFFLIPILAHSQSSEWEQTKSNCQVEARGSGSAYQQCIQRSMGFTNSNTPTQASSGFDQSIVNNCTVEARYRPSYISFQDAFDACTSRSSRPSTQYAPTTGTSHSELQKLKAELEEAKQSLNLIQSQSRIDATSSGVSDSQRLRPEGAVLQPRRVALVIGNSNYRVRPLRNPTNDANDVSSALKSSGFQVIDLRDASLQQMRVAVRQFGDRLINNDVGLVYYSGHGVEVKGRNYFIPVNADIQREDEIADQGLDVSLVLEKMSTAGKGVNILIVDACRDDPFGRSFRSSSRGLANMDAPRGTIIAYATSPGKVAADGDGRNSPYTKNLVRAMQQPNKPIEQVFKEVRRAVQAETKNQQTPWENTSLSGDFYFRVQR